ncbi:hypothetical protein F5J12DRAFT_783845 [Pisolithus orientalis]|uniref:uncharacterized protein n=1 Tax=Pisolithus orientalis TaxID=936130 RepID=UPI0022258C38|nr:uncharacterized protein F5J12DRAFT_783845 [Pisolithus orientalis]KAI6002364.1 hypothetical protein F5J12DRAFT_783845 [Pisolithus orientalis]
MMVGLQDGSIPATTFNWPMFFYEDSVYDPEDQLKGLFWGHIAWQSCYKQHIKEIKELHMESSESYTAYHCTCTHNFSSCLTLTTIEAYLTLSLAPKWANEFGDIDLQAMSWMIIEMFEHSNDQTHETLEWWNTYVVLTISMPNMMLAHVVSQSCAPASSLFCDSDVSENTNNSIASVNGPVIHPNGQHWPEHDVSPLTSDEGEDMEDKAPPPVHKTVPANKQCAASLLTNGNEDPEVLAPAHKKAAPVNKWHKKPVEQEDIFADTVDFPGTKTCNAMAHAHNQP